MDIDAARAVFVLIVLSAGRAFWQHCFLVTVCSAPRVSAAIGLAILSIDLLIVAAAMLWYQQDRQAAPAESPS